MIQEFVIHIGTYKTGTTSIQELLLVHEEQLKSKNIYVIDRERDFSEVSKWLFPVWHNVEDETKQESKAIQQILALKKSYISYEKVIYSEENFTDILCYEEQQSRLKKLKFLIDIFSARSNQVHVFYREPSTLLLSWYKQLLRNRNFNYPDYETFIEQNINGIQRACNWQDYSMRIESLIGKGNLKTHKFEDAISYGLARYFFNKILNVYSIGIKDKKLNKSQSDLKIRLLEAISNLEIKYKVSLINIGWLKQAVFEMEHIDDPKTMYKISTENNQKIKNLNNHSNVVLEKKGNKN